MLNYVMFMVLIKCLVDYTTISTREKLVNASFPTYQAAQAVKRYLVFSKHSTTFSLWISVLTIPLVFINEQWWDGTVCLMTLMSTIDWHLGWKANRKVNGGNKR